MKVWSIKHEGCWPVGACSIVVAENELEAQGILRVILLRAGINPDTANPEYTEIPLDKPGGIVILDGNY